MSKGIIGIVKNNAKTIVGVVGGLTIAGLSLMTARKGKTDEDYEIDEDYEFDGESEDETYEESAEESGEE